MNAKQSDATCLHLVVISYCMCVFVTIALHAGTSQYQFCLALTLSFSLMFTENDSPNLILA